MDGNFIDIVTKDEMQNEPAEDKATEYISFAGSCPYVQSGYPYSRM